MKLPALDLEFNQITPLGGREHSDFRASYEVDNGRERVTRDGRIQGVRSTGSLCYRVSGYVRTALQWEIHAELAEWAIRSLVMELPEPEIYYPGRRGTHADTNATAVVGSGERPAAAAWLPALGEGPR